MECIETRLDLSVADCDNTEHFITVDCQGEEHGQTSSTILSLSSQP